MVSNSTELARSGWTASASNSEGSLPPGNVLDNNNATRCGTGTQQASGQWFQVDLGSSHTFDRIVLDAGNSTDDFLRRYEIYATDNPSDLGTPLPTGAGITANGSSNGTGGGARGTPTTIYIAPQTKRYIRIVSKGSDSYYWWVIHELRVFNHSGTGVERGPNLITNPSFQADPGTQTPSGWNTWSSNSVNVDADYTETWGSRDGSLHGTHWKQNSSYDVYTYPLHNPWEGVG